MRKWKAGKRLGFTLIELLVVMAIIAILAAMLMPALESAREAAQRSVCRGNMRQIYVALTLYSNNFDGYPPPFHDPDPRSNDKPCNKNSYPNNPMQWDHRRLVQPLMDYGLTYGVMDCPSTGRLPGDPKPTEDDCGEASHKTAEGYCRYYNHRTDFFYLVGMGKGKGSFPYRMHPGWGNQGWDYYYKYMEWNDSDPLAAPIRYSNEPREVILADYTRFYTKSGSGDEYANANHGPYGAKNAGWRAFVEGVDGTNRAYGDGSVRWARKDVMAHDGTAIGGGTFRRGRYSGFILGNRDQSYYW